MNRTKIIYNLTKLSRLYSDWQKNFPKITPYYAVKCNPNYRLINELANLGCNFDCASRGEIELVRGITDNDIIYANPCKYEEDINYANEVGIRKTTFDTVNELYKMRGKNFESILRIYARDYDAECNLDKYGAIEEEWIEILKKCNELDINLTGVSFHIGSNAKNSDAFHKAIINSAKLFALSKLYNYNLEYLDIGGGFSVKTMSEFSPVINKTIEENFDKQVKIIAEPGRYFAETIAEFHTEIIGKKERNGKTYYWITDGVYGSFNSMFYDHQKPKPDKEEGNEVLCGIYGPTCDGLDIIIDDLKYVDKDMGQIIKWSNMGAYTFSAACDFNGIKQTNHFIEYI